MRKFWNFKAKDENRAELTLYGEISEVTWWGDEVTPKDFKRDLDKLGNVEEIAIYINSPGGDVFAGETIYNMLNRHPARKTVHIDGLAASIASIIAMVGDEIIMPENAMLMIHEAWTITSGNKNEIRSMADTLERIDENLIGIYTARTGKTHDEIEAMMKAETWITAAEAVEMGFADRVEENKKIAASVNGKMLIMGGVTVDMTRYAHAPEIRPCNGAKQQPVEEIQPKETGAITNDALTEQREMFNRVREKIITTYEKENAK